MTKFDLTTRNAAIVILLVFDLLLFYGTNAALFLALSVGGHTPTPPP